MFKILSYDSLISINAGSSTMSADGGGGGLNYAFTPKYGDLRDVPAAVGQAFSNAAKTIASDKELQKAGIGTAQITVGVVKNNPLTVALGWEKIKEAAGY